MLEVAMRELQIAAKDFYSLTGITLVLFDDKRQLLYAYPEQITPFCALLRTNEPLRKACFECDRIGFDYCDMTKAPYIYRCHMGLSEAITPIYENGIHLGYLMMGGILCHEDEALLEQEIVRICKTHHLQAEPLQSAAKELIRTDKERIYAALHMMSMCACYLYCNHIIRYNFEIQSAQLKEYIDRHFTENLTVSHICAQLYISRTKLYQLSKKAFGMSVNDYLRQKRITHAKKLLLTTDRPISEISEDVGFSDPNYFIRVFKKETATTPLAFRKKTK